MFGLRRKHSSPHPDSLQVMLPVDLLTAHSIQVKSIQRLAGVPESHWKSLYLDALLAYAGYVQLLPASESHHHPGPGGLLTHTLEAVTHALRIRRGHLLPQGADTEEITAKQDLWSYAVFSSTLLHDIGKPLMDQIVTLYDLGGQELGQWDALSPMLVGSWYRIRFRQQRTYRLHERAALLLSRLTLPTPALSWLASDQKVMAAWLAAVSGDYEEAGILGEISQQADSLSVAGNLGSPVVTATMPGARTPLHERLVTGLRYLLKEGKIPLNRDGAAAWFDGERLWLVSKRGIDALREHLTQEGHSGIPTRNDRIFDELQQHGITLANGERSIWKATVSGDGWSHTLTFLCFPVSRLWPDAHTRPDPFQGTITPVSEDGAAETEDENETSLPLVTTRKHSEPVSPLRASEVVDGDHESLTFEQTDECEDASPPDEDDSAGSADAGKAFLDWLLAGLREERFELNSATARIHRVEEGLLLVSPGIFKDFDKAQWQHAQKRFQKLKLHHKTSQGTNIYTYQVVGKRNKSYIKGFLIELPDAQFEGIALPLPNPHLSLIEGV